VWDVGTLRSGRAAAAELTCAAGSLPCHNFYWLIAYFYEQIGRIAAIVNLYLPTPVWCLIVFLPQKEA
jgi:hypothetical protein